MYLVCKADEVVFEGDGVRLGVEAGHRFKIEPLSYFERDGGSCFDLEHVSFDAAASLLECSPDHWSIEL